MPWVKGQSGNPEGLKRDKPYRDALLMEIAALAMGQIVKHPRGSLRSIVQARLLAATSLKFGTKDAEHVSDRTDGKVPQAIVGDSEHPPVGVIVTGVVRAVDRELSGGDPVPEIPGVIATIARNARDD
jgi:hypothetical protein